MTTPYEGDLRVWWVPQIPGPDFIVPVADVTQGALVLNTLAEYDAFQLINDVKPDYCNAGGLQVYENGEWLDWEHENHDGTMIEDPTDMVEVPSLGYCAQLP